MPLEIVHRAAPCRNVPVTFTLAMSKDPRALSWLLPVMCASPSALAQDGLGLGIGLALVFIVLPVLVPAILVGAVLWIVWRLWKGGKNDEAVGRDDALPPTKRMGE